MSALATSLPLVLAVGRQDSCGRGGIQADIETCLSLGCHCLPVITAISACDGDHPEKISELPTAVLIEQIRSLLTRMPVAVIKLGPLTQLAQVEALHSILRDYPQIPLVLDMSSGPSLGSRETRRQLREASNHLLLPLARIILADAHWAREWAPQADTLNACAQELLESQGEALLMTHCNSRGDQEEHRFYDRQGLIRRYQWPRLDTQSWDQNATLSAALAAYQAHGLRLADAVEQCQNFAWHARRRSHSLGTGLQLPNRLFWADRNKSEH